MSGLRRHSFNTVGQIVRDVTRGETLNILTFPTHERYESGLALTGHNFYSYRSELEGIEIKKDWNIKNGPIPENYILVNEVPSYVEFDLVLSQNRFGQYQLGNPVSEKLGIPIISLEHTLPIPFWEQSYFDRIVEMRGDINVFISEYSVKEWGWDIRGDTHIIHHMVDSDLFRPATEEEIIEDHTLDHGKNHLLSVVNDWKMRDYCCNYNGWLRITKGLPVRVVGDTKGLSEAAKSTEDLVKEYQSSKIFLNTSTISPVPTSLLEAMACGCACITTATCMIPVEVIEHGVNGLMSNDEKELTEFCNELLADDDLARRLGKEARKTVLEKFNKESFLSEWNYIFQCAIGK